MSSNDQKGSATDSPAEPARRVVITALGFTQILAWGSSYYLPGVLAAPVAADTDWPLALVVGGLSLGLLVAGIVSPQVGRAIQHNGGRLVLAFSSTLLAAGLGVLAVAQSLPVYFAAWLVMGVGMGAGLYDAVFAIVGRLYGQEARSVIASLTLFGGFASTICWPLSAFLVEHFGWRSACGVYAGLQLVIALPIHLLVLPRSTASRTGPASPADAIADREPRLVRRHLQLFALLAIVLTFTAIISSTVSVHLITILQARDMELAAAVGLGAILGPSQVGARLIEVAFGRHYHPIWTMLASVLLIAAGLMLLLVGWPIIVAALVLYGAGNGIGWIAKGTLPLVLFGSSHYAALMGWLALPSLLAQALSPSIAALVLDARGPAFLLVVLAGLGLLNVGFMAVLWRTYGHQIGAGRVR